jgi:CBS domain containing-hemolysin-like protein
MIQAQTDLEEVNEHLGISLPILEDYQTLGGFVMFHLQRIPESGESFYYENLEIKVISATGPRIEQVLIQIMNINDMPTV